MIHNIHIFLPRASFITIYKSLIRPLLEYVDLIYNQAYNNNFHQKTDTVYYNVLLPVPGIVKGTGREKMYIGIGIEN